MGAGWKVELDGKNVRVGCQSFDAKGLKSALCHLVGNAGPTYHSNGYSLYAYRNGVGRSNRNNAEISWEDADRLVEALKKAGF